ncbi:SDR family oxidoreductase [soil metagenome]
MALPDTGLEEYGEELNKKYGIEVQTLALNLADPDAAFLLHDTCQNNGWQVNMLINNVGLGSVGAFEKEDFLAIQYMMALNMTVMTQLTRLFLPQIKESDKGYILNVSSIAGLFPVPFKTIYSATKSFVYSFSRSMYFELEEDKVQVSCLGPGPVATNGQVKETNRQLGWKARYFTKHPEEVAEIAIDKMMRGKFLIIPGWENQLMTFVGKIIPEFILLPMMAKTFKRRTLAPGEGSVAESVAGLSAPSIQFQHSVIPYRTKDGE